MKLTTFTILHAFIGLQIYSNNAGFFDNEITENDIKFLVVQGAVVFVSLFNSLKDKEEKPSFFSVLLVLMLNIISVVVCYEIAIERETKIGMSMGVSFVVSLLFPYMIKALLNYAPIGFKKIAESLPDILSEKLKKILS